MRELDGNLFVFNPIAIAQQELSPHRFTQIFRVMKIETEVFV